ncbi:MAG: hypothetical protein EOP06_01385, partial [Proteobacteria bacterium]
MSTILSKFRNRIRTQLGLGIAEVLISTAAVSMLGLALATVAQTTLSGDIRQNLIRVIVTKRTEIDAALKHPAAWSRTLEHNAALNCATSPAGCFETSGS